MIHLDTSSCRELESYANRRAAPVPPNTIRWKVGSLTSGAPRFSTCGPTRVEANDETMPTDGVAIPRIKNCQAGPAFKSPFISSVVLHLARLTGHPWALTRLLDSIAFRGLAVVNAVAIVLNRRAGFG